MGEATEEGEEKEVVAPPLPQGRPLAQLVRQLWKEQEAALTSALRTQGAAAFIGFNPQAWFNVFLERIKPIYARYLVDGRAVMDAKLRRKKSLWHIFDAPQVVEPPEVDDEFSIYNPEAVNFINQYSYAFAQSAIDTTKMKLGNAYNRLKQELAQGIEQGEAIRTVTADVMRIFRDPARAMAIAVTETSRAYHMGQEIAAKQSGVVSGKKWLCSADACPICLELDGKVVALGEPFVVAGSGPYAKVMCPPRHVNCMCSMTEVLSDEWNPGETVEDWYAMGR